jgi:hypothetical protein
MSRERVALHALVRLASIQIVNGRDIIMHEARREGSMEEIVRISSIWPPTPERTHIVVFAHRDGRRVKYVRGLASENDASRALLAQRGNICGTVSSVEIWEAFPDEPVCRGCVAPSEIRRLAPDGTEHMTYGTTHPDFENAVRSGYCPACRDREAAQVRQQYERDMKHLGLDPYANG